MNAWRQRLPVAVLLSALLAIGSGLGWMPAAVHFIAKPLTTLLIILYAMGRDGGSPAPRRWVLLGLAMSLCGDVALMWPQQGFVPGLVAFLLAHLCYLVAFTRVTPLASSRWPFVANGLVAGFIAWQLWPGIPQPLRAPVVAYVGCLAMMAAQAAAVWRASVGGVDGRRAAVLALGGALFVLSDAILATDKFAVAVPMPAFWILGTYWGAQWGIASWLRSKVRVG